jgi:predicted O-methyltransferase YrrM
LLYGLVRALKPTVCVEIGAARGKSACSIGLALRENGHGRLYTIDPHMKTAWNDTESTDTWETFSGNVRRMGLTQVIEVKREVSQNVASDWTLPIDILFIDGDHSYEGVKQDWTLFARFVTEFGVVIFHDTLWDVRPDPNYQRDDMGVPRFVEELRRDGYPVVTFDKNYGVTLVQPTKYGVALSGRDAMNEKVVENRRHVQQRATEVFDAVAREGTRWLTSTVTDTSP